VQTQDHFALEGAIELKAVRYLALRPRSVFVGSISDMIFNQEWRYDKWVETVTQWRYFDAGFILALTGTHVIRKLYRSSALALNHVVSPFFNAVN
jgi:hypothetical protein